MKRSLKTTVALAVATLGLLGAVSNVQASESPSHLKTQQVSKKNPFRLRFEKIVLTAYNAVEEMAESNYGQYKGLTEDIRKAKESLQNPSSSLIEVASSVIRFAQKLNPRISTVDDFVNYVTNDFIQFQSHK